MDHENIDRGDSGTSIHLASAEDMDAVRVFLAVVQDVPDTGREIVRRMSPKDRAVLAFYLRDAGRIVEEEEGFRETQDRRNARDTHEAEHAWRG